MTSLDLANDWPPSGSIHRKRASFCEFARETFVCVRIPIGEEYVGIDDRTFHSLNRLSINDQLTNLALIFLGQMKTSFLHNH
jgi:hypothetical protein